MVATTTTLCPGKRPKCFYCNTLYLYKTRALSKNLVHAFVNKFAAKSYKRFTPRVNNVSKLPCESSNALHARVTIELLGLDKETP